MRFQNNGNIDFHVWGSGAADTTGDGHIPLILKNDGDAYFNGNVGIGTSNPTSKLKVYSGGTITLDPNFNQSSIIIKSTPSTTGLIL